MAVSAYLAMTAAEISAAKALPGKLAYMACHFSPYGLGLSNCPDALPPDSMLIINDRTPISGHDPALIAKQVKSMVDALGCSSVLLDFQRPDCEQTAGLCRILTSEPPCPVAVSDLYAKGLSCPVFLSPPALHHPLAQHLSQWENREIWLEAALEAACIRITEKGSTYTPQIYTPPPAGCFAEDGLHCSYHQERNSDSVLFYLYRTPAQLSQFMENAQTLGVTQFIGLYQQFSMFNAPFPDR